MRIEQNRAYDIKIAYIGGGSRGWAWGLMSDLASCKDISGTVDLYDIDKDAALANEIIGNKYNHLDNAKSIWTYKARNTIEEALEGADFVIISILPGTFDEMESDVHAPEKYGIYQSVGDTTGPGGIIRALRTVPMYEYIAEKIRDVVPDAWVISYTNPMTLCIKTLYRVFPGIRAFGCCHEVFGTQKFLAKVVEEKLNTGPVEREEIKVNPVGVNHFTWLTEARYMEKDLFPLYREFCLEHKDGYKGDGPVDSNWMNNHFASEEKVKMDLFLRFGVAGAAGDRHLAEFCSGNWYLGSPENVRNWHFSLTPVSWRKKDLKEKLERSKRLVSGEEQPVIGLTGEEGTNQIRAILGLGDLVTNVNIPNQGQIPDLPSGAVVETNAVFSSGSVRPVMAGKLPESIAPMVKRIASIQELLSDGIAKRDLKTVFAAFINDPLMTCSIDDAKALFKEMCLNTRKYLTMYDLSELDML